MSIKLTKQAPLAIQNSKKKKKSLQNMSRKVTKQTEKNDNNTQQQMLWGRDKSNVQSCHIILF